MEDLKKGKETLRGDENVPAPEECDIYQKIAEGDTPYESFMKRHNIIACPECGGELDFIGYEEVGEHGKIIRGETDGNNHSDMRTQYTLYLGNADGAKHNGRFDCKKCGFAFLKQTYSEYNYHTSLEKSYKNTLVGYMPISECSERTKAILEKSGQDWFYEELRKP